MNKMKFDIYDSMIQFGNRAVGFWFGCISINNKQDYNHYPAALNCCVGKTNGKWSVVMGSVGICALTAFI